MLDSRKLFCTRPEASVNPLTKKKGEVRQLPSSSMKNSTASDVEAMWKTLALDTRGETVVSFLANLCDEANPNYNNQSCFEAACAKKAYGDLKNKPLHWASYTSLLIGVALVLGSLIWGIMTFNPQSPNDHDYLPTLLVFWFVLTVVPVSTYLFTRANKENFLNSKINFETVIFFERAAELFITLQEHLSGALGTDNLRVIIERTALALAGSIKKRSAIVTSADLSEDKLKKEREQLRAVVDLAVHLKLMDTGSINALMFDESDWNALNKYRAEMLYKKLFEATEAV